LLPLCVARKPKLCEPSVEIFAFQSALWLPTEESCPHCPGTQQIIAHESDVADTLKLSGLNVPILVQAYPDDVNQFTVERRRDGFCGKISVCNDLRQYGFAYTLTDRHTVHPLSAGFRAALQKFVGVCKVVNGLRGARLGAIGARPGAFNTVRFSEKLLQAYGISVTTIDLSEIFGLTAKLADADARVVVQLDVIASTSKSSA
jgi:L-fucose isomerase-like protein